METIVVGGEWHGTKAFKSYYVVWKPKNNCRNHGEPESLNRTMQYGNIAIGIGTALARFGLNRTMQYGNCSPS